VDAEVFHDKVGEAAPPLPGGSETVLLVEDDHTVRGLAGEMLEMNGYTVLVARDGREALDLVRRQRRSIHLLLTDVVMPQMSGRELAEGIASIHPGIRVLYMSGYTDGVIAHHGVLEAGVAYLQKPFTADFLARKVREVLDAGAGRARGGAGDGA
jgi:two-component system, cell cycle sensor histidine kinase and response regulator CckA